MQRCLKIGFSKPAGRIYFSNLFQLVIDGFIVNYRNYLLFSGHQRPQKVELIGYKSYLPYIMINNKGAVFHIIGMIKGSCIKKISSQAIIVIRISCQKSNCGQYIYL